MYRSGWVYHTLSKQDDREMGLFGVSVVREATVHKKKKALIQNYSGTDQLFSDQEWEVDFAEENNSFHQAPVAT